MQKTMQGFYWNYNVHKGAIPIPEFGRVYYVVDDMGFLVLVNRVQLGYSIA